MKKLKIKQKSNRSGFTLVELVITIAIVIILSVIAVPIYRGYVDKSKMSEGYALLGAILSAQKAYYSEYGNFLRFQECGIDYTSYHTILGIDARGNKYFTWFAASYRGGIEEKLDAKNYFDASVYIPKELVVNNENRLRLMFFVTGGATVDKLN